MIIGNLPSLRESDSRYVTMLIVIALLDIGRISEIMRQEFTKINKTDYLVASMAIGTSWYKKIVRYYIPNIYQKLIYIFISDMSRIMILLGGLGIVEVYLAQDMVWDVNEWGFVAVSQTFTWPSLLGNAMVDLRTAPWILFFPSLSIAIMIIGLNLFGEGLKDLKITKQRNETDSSKSGSTKSQNTEERWGINDTEEKISV